MKYSLNSTYSIILATVSGALLVACGGGQSGSAGMAPAATEPSTLNSTTTADNAAAATLALVKLKPGPQPAPITPVTPIDVPPSSVVTDFKLESTLTAGAAQSNVPVSFGQVFARGDVLATNSLVGQLPDGTALPLQMDVKATHPDGSIRHAVLSAVLPTLAPSALTTIKLAKTAAAAQAATPVPATLLAAGFTSQVKVALDGVSYSASADELLKGTNYKTWLAGPIANEWIVSAPLKTANGTAHPHLTARFAIRWYSAIKKARVDVTVENDWAYEAAPRNFTYDAQVLVGGLKVYDKPALTHFHHARWRKMFWWGETPQVHVRHNTPYLISTRAVPNYDQTVVVSESALATYGARWTGAATEPMTPGYATGYMPMAGGRQDIGLLPAWSAAYLLSMDKRAKDVMLGTADLAGSWSSHFRDKRTDKPVSLIDFPYMTILGRDTDTYNSDTGKYEAFPSCASANACVTPYDHDTSHQPNLAYLPYLVTGDYYYLEELQFWAMYDVFSSNPGYRENKKGLIQSDQVRGQAWSLRTLSEAAYITPDQDPLKSHFEFFMSSNLDWYNANYSTNSSANTLGVIVHNAFAYSNGTGIAPWQDDFFTSAVGHAVELGFVKAAPLLAFKAKFPISRMIGDGACWIDGAIYSMIVRDSETSAVYATIAQAYRASHTAEVNAMTCNSKQMADSLGVKVGEMAHLSESPEGYPSNMQPALAYGASAGGTPGIQAWTQFMARTVKPNYGDEPQFAIVPR